MFVLGIMQDWLRNSDESGYLGPVGKIVFIFSNGGGGGGGVSASQPKAVKRKYNRLTIFHIYFLYRRIPVVTSTTHIPTRMYINLFFLLTNCGRF